MKSRKGYLEHRERCRRLEGYGGRMDGECPLCGGNNIFQIARFDAKFCMDCDWWLEEKCSDPGCPLCRDRPSAPSGVMFDEPSRPASKEDRRRAHYQHKTDSRAHHERRYRK